MDLVHTLVEQFFGSRSGELYVGGVPITSLAERHGTPLFIYDRGVMDNKLRTLRDVLTPEFDVFYSVKANPNAAIVHHFVKLGCGLEVASGGEFIQALAAGCPAERVFFAGPGKTNDELELTLSNNIGEIHIESPLEAGRVSDICKRRNIRARVAVRVNPANDTQGGAMRMGGKSTPFGVDEEKLDPLIQFLISEPWLDFRGVHMFSGTQILDFSVLMAQYRKCIEIARRIVSKVGRPLHTVDFGGGLGIRYFSGEAELNLGNLRAELASFMSTLRKDADFQGTRFVVEPGRFLVGEAGVYVARITDIKESRGKKFLILDGGMNHHLAASGNLGQTIKRNYPIALVEKLGSASQEKVDVVGPLCTPLDTLGRDVYLPEAKVGELLGIFQSGAYARSASPLGFLSRNTPAEVWIDEGTDVLIRTRGCTQDFMRDECLPALKVEQASCVR
jgi:diaminopimelate decarboxylase